MPKSPPKHLISSSFALTLIHADWLPFLTIRPTMIDPKSIAYPLLLTDCSTPGLRAGILGPNGWLAYKHSEGETGSMLFLVVKQLLESTSLSLKDLQSFAYCDGPGSTLGIRINSMALRTWNSLVDNPRPIYAYRSLVAAGIMIRSEMDEKGDFTVLSDLRKHSWNALQVRAESNAGDIQVVSQEDIGDWPCPRYFIQQRIHSPGLPPESKAIRYDLEAIGPQASFLSNLSEVETPEVFQTTTTEFKKWSPSRHR